ncbi:MAG: dienelactone hydrolase family protein [Deltaproteobacteria bacterium]|nr:dienelactone hydrolase family protein [Deltaproteobacteria bacterium]
MRQSIALSVCFALFGSFLAARASAQAPEDRGPLTVETWDAGTLTLDGARIRTRVYYPAGAGPTGSGGPFPLVGVIHGANANGAYHTELASTLASRGFVAVVPDMPCTVTACDHDANQRQITALLAWAVAQSADPSSRLSGTVDGSRRGLIGHSWGGLSSHITAARDPSIDSVVLLDPNDDGTDGLSVTASITAPHLTLLAEVPGACNAAWQEAMVRTRLTSPHLDFTLDGSGHCNPGEMDLVCSFGCGRGDSATTPLFRRYAVAWTACVLAGDASMAEWLGGASYDGEVSAGRIVGPMASMLDGLPCRSGGLPDAGVIETPDAGAVVGDDAAVASEIDAGTITESDAFVASGIDSGRTTAIDAGAGTSSSGCSCRVGARAPTDQTTWLAVFLGGLLATRVRRRR